MNPSTLEIIHELLTSEYCEIHAMRLHLEHQLDLPPEFRIMDAETATMEQQRDELRFTEIKLLDALEDLNFYKLSISHEQP